ncbi:unnamed protein product, partial [Rhizoctonia solani]
MDSAHLTHGHVVCARAVTQTCPRPDIPNALYKAILPPMELPHFFVTIHNLLSRLILRLAGRLFISEVKPVEPTVSASSPQVVINISSSNVPSEMGVSTRTITYGEAGLILVMDYSAPKHESESNYPHIQMDRETLSHELLTKLVETQERLSHETNLDVEVIGAGILDMLDRVKEYIALDTGNQKEASFLLSIAGNLTDMINPGLDNQKEALIMNAGIWCLNRALQLDPISLTDRIIQLLATLFAKHLGEYERPDRLNFIDMAIEGRHFNTHPENITQEELATDLAILGAGYLQQSQELARPSEAELSIVCHAWAVLLTPREHPGLVNRI